MMKRSIRTRAVACCLTTVGAMLIGSQAYGAERELDAHQHGHGSLNIAIEGSTLWIELETPGADIVGFEHPARSDDDKAAIENARGRLSDPIGMFGIPAQASCTLVEVLVEPVGYELGADDDRHVEHDAHEDHDEHAEDAHEDHDEHAEDAHDEHDEHEEAHEDEKESHAEFHAEYRLQCADPAAIASLTLTYFDVFPGAEELEVNLITDDGQSRQEITPAEPVVHVGGN